MIEKLYNDAAVVKGEGAGRPFFIQRGITGCGVLLLKQIFGVGIEDGYFDPLSIGGENRLWLGISEDGKNV